MVVTDDDEIARLAAISGGLARVGREIPVVLPLHPRTRSRLAEAHGLRLPVNPEEPSQEQPYASAVRLIGPVGYVDMLMLEKNARLITTDSGGVQKEAFFFRVPCVTLRDETEWVELVEAGWNRLVPPESADDVSAGVLGVLQRSASGPEDGGSRALAGWTEAAQLYGGGDAARRIAQELLGC